MNDRAAGMARWEPLRLSAGMLTGDERIDSQHQVLIDILNELAEQGRDPCDPHRFDQVTRDLLGYVLFHFEAEEQLIRESGFDVADPAAAQEHVGQHRGFVARVLAMRAEASAQQSPSQADLREFLRDWLIHHIGTTDQRLGHFLCAQAVGR